MKNENIETAKQYYEGWESSDRSRLRLAPDLKFSSPDDSFNSADEYLNSCWQYSGMKFHNKIILGDDNNICIKYEMKMPDGSFKPFIEWLVFKEGMISEIHVFYHKTDQ